jgi:hypothetical protein
MSQHEQSIVVLIYHTRYNFRKYNEVLAVPWLRQLVTGISTRRPGKHRWRTSEDSAENNIWTLERKYQEDEKNCIIGSFISCALHYVDIQVHKKNMVAHLLPGYLQ